MLLHKNLIVFWPRCEIFEDDKRNQEEEQEEYFKFCIFYKSKDSIDHSSQQRLIPFPALPHPDWPANLPAHLYSGTQSCQINNTGSVEDVNSISQANANSSSQEKKC
ncbi:conserved hypothetical protein [Ricinus communis]|uniref:Uncharacterized protein n=1 Tax=Ricinus communis TaxID=3988 RepID=B9RNJ9_RICCO|nr:conserved hypothetical protein [Ricinus communis]